MSSRRLDVKHYSIRAELDGQGNLRADPYPLFPRAFLWAHLDDEIMEAVTTNWGNEGIYMEGVGPSLVGRIDPNLGPLQRIPLGGALYFDAGGNLSYDPSAMLAQIASLQQQVALLTSQVQTLYLTLKSSAFNPYGQASLAGAGAMAAALSVPLSLTASAMQGSGNLQAAIGFQLPTGALGFFGSGNLSAAALVALSVKSTMAGASSSLANLTQVPSSFKQIGSQLFAGASGGTSKLGVGLAASAALAGASNLGINPSVSLGASATLAGSSSTAVKLVQTLQVFKTLAGVGSVTSNLILGFSSFNPAKKAPSLVLSNNNRTVTEATDGSYGTVAGTRAHTTGDGQKYYFEARLDSFASQTASSITGIGICTSADTSVGTDTNGIGNTTTSWGLTSIGGSYCTRNNGTSWRFPGFAPTNGDILQVAVDCAANLVYLGLNGVWPGGGAFSAGTSDFSLPGATVMLLMAGAIRVSGVTDQITINIGNAAFAFAPPAGYIAWG